MGRSSRPDMPSVAESEDRLAWIFGSSRSGSTWLLRMLAELDDVVPIDDPHLGHHLGVWRPISLAWAAAEYPPELTTLDRVKHDKDSYFFSDRYRSAWHPALRRLVADRFDAEARDHLRRRGRRPTGAAAARDGAAGGAGRHGDGRAAREAAVARPVVVVKEPGSHVADRLVELFPGSRVVFLLRDGRDVVDSWLAAYRAGSWALDEGAFPATDEGRVALVRWQAAVWAFRTEMVRRVYAAHPPGRRALVRYEDLVRDPVGELARVVGALGLAVGRHRLAAAAAAHDYARVPPERKGPGRFIRSATPGGWRDNLTAAEQEAMTEVLGPVLAAVGYGPAPAAAGSPAG